MGGFWRGDGQGIRGDGEVTGPLDLMLKKGESVLFNMRKHYYSVAMVDIRIRQSLQGFIDDMGRQCGVEPEINKEWREDMVQLLMKYPEVPGHKGERTSYEASMVMRGRAPKLRYRCLTALENAGPMTADEVAEVLGESVLSIRPRFSELKRNGLILPTGERRKNISGRPAVVWAYNGKRENR